MEIGSDIYFVGVLWVRTAQHHFELSGYQTLQAIQADDFDMYIGFDICHPGLKRDNGKSPTNGDVKGNSSIIYKW